MTARLADLRCSRRRFIVGGASAVVGARAFAQDADPTRLSIAAAAGRLRRGELSPVALANAYLERIARLDGRINAYITLTDRLALEQAAAAEAELARGVWRGPLHGIPIALKDNMDTAGIRTTAASALFENRVPSVDAEVYRRLREAGAVLLGKLNLHEFAYGGTSAITHFGPVHNPWDLERIPGGSSGGSAAAVAARLCAAALGTDTLASIRQPAAFCGVVGFKATHGLASIRGIVPIAESLDHVGPLARSVADAALVLDAIAGYDALDPVSIRSGPRALAGALGAGTARLRLGLPRLPYYERLDPDIAAAMDEALAVLGRLTHSTRDVSLPEVPSFEPLLAEAYAYHEQYLNEPANHARYDPVTLARILAAGEFSSADYIDARRELTLARRRVARVFEQVDLLVTPTTPVMPSTIDNAEIPETASGAESTVRNTAPFNLYGIPTINLPCGFGRSGLPIGLQISGPRLGELDVLALADAYEQATAWHLEEPALA